MVADEYGFVFDDDLARHTQIPVSDVRSYLELLEKNDFISLVRLEHPDGLKAHIEAKGRTELSKRRSFQEEPEREAGSSSVHQSRPQGLAILRRARRRLLLELLPGPRRADSLPESVHFWKVRIEETDPEKTFSVGVIFGPSGCGKSSLVKAGLLPRLSKSVIPVYVEATAEETEARLLKGLRKHIPDLPPDLDLQNSLIAVKERVGGGEKKLLLVMDQFEQWLQRQWAEQGTELTRALLESDGERVQGLVLVRDDFSMALFRFMNKLGIRIIQGQNFAVVDLFDHQHARSVLTAFGRGYGVLPDDPETMTEGQNKFLDRAINGLSQEGRVISVRLALFAEMVKGKPWTPETLKQIGGATGVGVTFLEETFSARSAPPPHRIHQKAAQAVLKALLPESGSDIKGHMRSHLELLEVSGYGSRTNEFDDLLRILDSELRLITPTDPEGATGEEQPTSGTGERYYQLTHDYLVHSLREWLTRKQKETRRGRAELLLAERASLWHAKPENRRLPSPLEWANICLLTRKKDWNEPQRRMMRKAGWVHGSRTLAALVLLGLLTWGGIEGYDTLQASRLAESWIASTTDFPALVQQLDGYRRWAKPVLEAELAQKPAPDATADAQDRLAQRQARAAVALLRWGQGEKVWNLLRHSPDPSVRSYIVNWLKPLGAGPEALMTKLEGIAHDPDSIPKDGKSRMDAILFHPETSERRALILALGGYDPDELSPDKREPLVEHLLEMYRNDPDAGIHGAAEWMLRRWKHDEKLAAIDVQLKKLKDRGNRRWYVNSEGQTLAVIGGPIEFSMGSPVSEPDRFSGETPHRQPINRRFAIATKEVTVEQYQRFLKENPQIKGPDIDKFSPEPTGPVNRMTWYEAAAYCNWLSQQEGLATCYEPNERGQYAEGMKIVPDALKQPGYRLPTEAEWEYACRAGAVTSRYYGRSVELLGKYAWYFQNSQNRAWPCGQLLPNELGLFDMLGNVYEWCHEQYYPYPEGEGNTTTDDMNILLSIKEQNPRILRGGTFYYHSTYVRSASRFWVAPSDRSAIYGFRSSRTYH